MQEAMSWVDAGRVAISSNVVLSALSGKRANFLSLAPKYNQFLSFPFSLPSLLACLLLSVGTNILEHMLLMLLAHMRCTRTLTLGYLDDRVHY